mgnify:CR=1 FL=1
MKKIHEFKREIKYVPELSTQNIDRKRYYVTPKKLLYPSIRKPDDHTGKSHIQNTAYGDGSVIS